MQQDVKTRIPKNKCEKKRIRDFMLQPLNKGNTYLQKRNEGAGNFVHGPRLVLPDFGCVCLGGVFFIIPT